MIPQIRITGVRDEFLGTVVSGRYDWHDSLNARLLSLPDSMESFNFYHIKDNLYHHTRGGVVIISNGHEDRGFYDIIRIIGTDEQRKKARDGIILYLNENGLPYKILE